MIFLPSPVAIATTCSIITIYLVLETKTIHLLSAWKVETMSNNVGIISRNNVETEYHPSCTCKMGDTSNDNMAVVDNEAKVVGE